MGTKQLLVASCSSVCIHSSHCTHCTCAGILHHGTDCYCSSLKYLPHFNWTVGEKRVFSRSLITHGKKIVENSTSLSSWDGRVLKNLRYQLLYCLVGRRCRITDREGFCPLQLTAGCICHTSGCNEAVLAMQHISQSNSQSKLEVECMKLKDSEVYG